MDRKQVWIVDDEKELASSYSDFLEDQFDLRVFNSAEEALKQFDQDPASPDMIVSDICMPGMDGISFVETLRSKGMGKPVVMISGYAEKKDLLRANDLKISGFLEKPCDPQNLRHSINGAMRADELSSITEQLIALLSQQSNLFESIISKCVERYAHAENLLDESEYTHFADRDSIRIFLEKIYTENKMHRELLSLQKKIGCLRIKREVPSIKAGLSS